MKYIFYANVELCLFNNIQVFCIFVGIILIILYVLIYLSMRIHDNTIYMYACLCIFTYILVVVYGPIYFLLKYILIYILGNCLFIELFSCICVIIYLCLCILYLIYSIYCYISIKNIDINSIKVARYKYIFRAISIICIIIAIMLCVDCLSLLILSFLCLNSVLPFKIFSANIASKLFKILTKFELLFLLKISIHNWLCTISLIIVGISSYFIKRDIRLYNLDYTNITIFHVIFAITVMVLFIVFILLIILLLFWV